MRLCNQTVIGGLVLTGLVVGAVGSNASSPKLARRPDAMVELREPEPGRTEQLRGMIAAQPLMFEQNQGQAASGIRYLSRGNGYTLAISPRETMLTLRGGKSASGSTLRTRLVGPKARQPQVTSSRPLRARVNYFYGKDPSKWRTDIPTYERVKMAGVYPGVDLVYYGGQRQLEYDFVVAPGADPGVIRMQYGGARKLHLDRNGDLLLSIGEGEIRQHKPSIYQEVNGRRRPVDGSFVLDGEQVGFRVAAYDTTRPLVIDPILVFATYFGGGQDDRAYGCAVDSTGAIYVVGETKSTTPIPIPTLSAYDSTYNGTGSDSVAPGATAGDAFALKFDSNGQLVYSTYLGSAGGDKAYDVALDGSGCAYIVGFTGFTTSSPAFPTTVGARRTSYAGGNSDAFIVKLNAAGNSLTYSTLLGGTGGVNGEDRLFDVSVDGSGRAYVCGFSSSTTGLGTTADAAMPTNRGTFDGLFCIVSATGAAYDYCTYLGGNNNDGVYSLARSGSVVYFAGSTYSTNWGTTNYITINPTGNPSSTNLGSYSGNSIKGGMDAMVLKLDLSKVPAQQLAAMSYLGGQLDDEGLGCVVDASGNVYVAGATRSTGFPSTSGVIYPQFQGNDTDAYVVKLNSSLTSVSYSTFFGGTSTGATRAEKLAINPNNEPVIAGRTSQAIPTTADAIKSIPTLWDGFITTFSSTGNSLIYSSLIGGGGYDYGWGLSLDTDGNIYVVGETNSNTTNTPFPTQSPYQANNAGGYDAFLYRRPTKRPPTISAPSSQCVRTTAATTLAADISDLDGDALTITWKIDGVTRQTTSVAGSYPTSATTVHSTFTYTYPSGAHTVTITVTDGVYSPASTITLTGDDIPPVINSGNPLPDVLYGNEPGECYYTINSFPVPSVSDACGTPTLSGVRSQGGPGLNGQYDVGETIITWTATDEAGNTAVKTQRVYITDVEPPVINPDPLPTIEVTDSDGDGVEYVDPMSPTFGGPVTATDNCPEMLMFDGYRDNPGDNEPTDPNDDWPLPSGNYPLGVTKITWIAVDSEINVTIAEQLVIVHGTSTISSKFDVAGDSTDGWSVTSGATGPTYVTTGGTSNGGGAGDGFIRGTDTSTSTQWYFTAPSKFHGNRQGAYGQSLGFALKQNGGNAGSVTSTTADVILQGGGYTLVASLAPSSAPSSGWSSYSVNFSTAAWVFQGTSTHPSAAQLQQALGSVYNLQIRGKYDTANAVTMDLDNVVLNQSY